MKQLYFLTCFVFATLLGSAQNNFHDYGFRFYDSIEVQGVGDNCYSCPWVGGMNFCQFSNCDFDFDGLKDLFVFDRSGNRKMIFLNDGSGYSFSQKLADEIPNLGEWAFFCDFNNDGKEDIFSYTTGGIVVFKNTSSNNELSFTRITEPFIYSLQGTVLTNLYVTPVDLPAVSDIDNDGDYDILTFWGLGQYVQYHKNLSIEKYGHADSLIYELVDYCWGDFEESEDDNILTLDIQCPFEETSCTTMVVDYPKDRHVGSTLLAIDLDGDIDKDLLLGDIDYPTLFKLENGGDIHDAHMINQDTSFPSSTPINLISFPAPFYVDVNNDNVKDLLVSPFDEKMFNPVSENVKTSWFYQNEGSNDEPVFSLVQQDFLQDGMLDFGAGAYPVPLDYNNDGLIDIAVANYGYRDSSYYQNYTLYSTYKSQIALLQNIGNINEPQFKIVDFDLGNISELKLLSVFPTFFDIDNDSDIDMFVGNSEGTIIFFENLSQSNNEFDFDIPQENYQSIDAGQYSAPQLFDVDKDGLVDLLMGCKLGSIQYYKNIGSQFTPEFSLINEELGGVDVRDLNISNFGYSIPCFFEQDGESRLFVGSESGKIFYYKNIDGNLAGDFELYDGNLLGIYEGQRIGVAVQNFDGDEYMDLLVGNYAGGITYYKGVFPSGIGTDEGVEVLEDNFLIYPNPAQKQIRIEVLDKDIFLSNVKVFSIEGKLLVEMSSGKDECLELDVTNLEGGVYFIQVAFRVNDVRRVATKKIVVGD